MYYTLVKAFIDYATQAAKNEQPMMTQIVLIDEKPPIWKQENFSLWIAHGDLTPIDRIGQLRKQMDVMKAMLEKLYKNPTVSEVDKTNISLIIETYETK